MSRSGLSWREKIAIADTTSKIAAVMLLVIAAVCEVFMKAMQ